MSSFEQRYGPWYQRRSDNWEDRRDEPWPWHQISKQHPIYSPTNEEAGMRVLDSMQASAPQRITPLSQAAGVRDIQTPTAEELIRFLINVDLHNER